MTAPYMEPTQPKRSIWDRINGGIDTLLGVPTGGLLTDTERDFARRRGLLSAGNALLQSAQPPAPFQAPIGLGPAIGNALEAGQTGALKSVSESDALRARLTAQAQAGRVQAFRSKWSVADQSNPDILKRMYADAIATGLTDEAKSLGEVIKSMGGAESFKLDTIQGPHGPVRIRVGPTGKPEELGPAGPDELSQQRAFTRENQLADDYYRELNNRGYQKLYTNVDSALSNRAAAKAGDGAAQVNLLYAFITSMDPTSVVREGEITLAKQAASIYDQVEGLYNKYLKGESVVVPPEMINQISDLMERRMGAVERDWSGIRDQYAKRGERWKIDPEAFSPAPAKYRGGAPKGSEMPKAAAKTPAGTTPAVGDVLDGFLPK